MSENPPILLSLGGYKTIYGLVKENKQLLHQPTIYGEPIHQSSLSDGKSYFAGDMALKLRGVCKLIFPIDREKIQNWGELMAIIAYLLSDIIRVEEGADEFDYVFDGLNSHKRLIKDNLTNHPVFIISPRFADNRELHRLSTLMYNYFGINKLIFVTESLLLLQYKRLSSSLVVDMGEFGITIEAFINYQLIDSLILDYGGFDITEFFREISQSEKIWLEDQELKEKYCYVSLDIRKEKLLNRLSEDVIQGVISNNRKYKIGEEKYLAPELIFDPLMIDNDSPSLPEAIISVLNNQSDMLKSELCQNIILIGGTSRFKGMVERLRKEIIDRIDDDIDLNINRIKDEQTYLKGGIKVLLKRDEDPFISPNNLDNENIESLLYHL